MDGMAENDCVGSENVIAFLQDLKIKVAERCSSKIESANESGDDDLVDRLESSSFEDQSAIDSVIGIVKDYSG